MPNLPTRSAEHDELFFAALENGLPVRAACAAAGYARRCVYRWREEDEGFAQSWAKALTVAADLLEEEADRRGRDGYDEPVFSAGELAGVKRKYSDRLLLARLKALKPDQYRERIPIAGAQANITVVVRDFRVDEAMARLIADHNLDPEALPEPLRPKALPPKG